MRLIHKSIPALACGCAVAIGGAFVITGKTLTAVYSPYPAGLLPTDLQSELRRVQTEVDTVEQRAIQQWHNLPINPNTVMKQVETLGKLELYDTSLSVNRNMACTSCHMPYTGFSGPISSVNATIANYPGSIPHRIAVRRPQAYTYAPYAPTLHYNDNTGEFFGGNFWDLRATGVKSQNPSIDQAEGPPIDPDELGLPDSACVVYRLSRAPYRQLFETVWGTGSFDIRWPADIEAVCARPAPSAQQQPVNLSTSDRQRADDAYHNFARAIAAEEYSKDESAFSSKFDYALAHPDQQVLTADELAGWKLFNGKAHCNFCHVDGTPKGAGGVPLADMAVNRPLFTDWSASNLGLPRNPMNPYYYEDKPDPYGFTPNPQGFGVADLGLAQFLKSAAGKTDPNSDWAPLANAHAGEFQTSTVRNADMRPCPTFVKAYFHNGYIKSLKELVHFYNTRDIFRKNVDPGRCPAGTIEKVTCWPRAEVPENQTSEIGNLGLTDQEENQVVAFMTTLTDGYTTPYPDKDVFSGACPPPAGR